MFFNNPVPINGLTIQINTKFNATKRWFRNLQIRKNNAYTVILFWPGKGTSRLSAVLVIKAYCVTTLVRRIQALVVNMRRQLAITVL